MSIELFKQMEKVVKQMTALIESHENRITNTEADVKAIGKHLLIQTGRKFDGKETCTEEG
jgi:hypothetical protein